MKNQYLLNYLSTLERRFIDHDKKIMEKKYLLLRDGEVFTGTDDKKEVVQACACNKRVTFKENI